MTPMSTTRSDLIAAVLAAGREQSTAAIMFHTAVAKQVGLSATETKTIGLLDEHGAMTPGELARESGLAPASMTALVDRLSRRDIVRRIPHPDDGRKVLIELRAGGVPDIAPLFDDFSAAVVELCETFTDAELATIASFLTRGARVQHEATMRLTASDEV